MCASSASAEQKFTKYVQQDNEQAIFQILTVSKVNIHNSQ